MDTKITNPFIVSGKIAPEYFCDRKKESAALIKAITNNNNLVLISPRRMGKTGLVYYCYDHEAFQDTYTFFVDILHTTSLQEFTYLFGRKVYDVLMTKSKKLLLSFVQALKTVSGQFGFDPVTNTPTFSLTLGDFKQPELTLEEIFGFLEHADRPCIVTFDEFQQISKYPEKNMEALLRTYIQQMSNCHFIFSGSEYHVMQEMFISSAHPFYNSADILELKAIPQPVYSSFVRACFAKAGKGIDDETIEYVYQLFHGNTYGMQKTFNEAFTLVENGEHCDMPTLQEAINNIIEQKEPFFSEQLSNIPEKYKPLLYAIARDGEVEQITSKKFVQKHRLPSASANQYAMKKLIELGIVTKLRNKYSVTEQFFDLWINRLYGTKR